MRDINELEELCGNATRKKIYEYIGKYDEGDDLYVCEEYKRYE